MSSIAPDAVTALTLVQRVGGTNSTGRHIEHDPRSRSYAFVPRQAGALASVQHVRKVPVFDQGTVGSCTGQAMAGALGCEPFLSTQPKPVDSQTALTLYAIATQLDSIAGSWPPMDTGSTSLGVAKAAVRERLISGYQHTFTVEGALAALAKTPVLMGSNWYRSFDTPDAQGIISIAPGAPMVGGHEYVLDGLDVERELVWATNSWSARWGKQGRFAIPFELFRRLLAEKGDVLVPVPLSAPAPTPSTPTSSSGGVVNPLPPAPTPAPAPAPTPAPTPRPMDRDARLEAEILGALTRWKNAPRP